MAAQVRRSRHRRKWPSDDLDVAGVGEGRDDAHGLPRIRDVGARGGVVAGLDVEDRGRGRGGGVGERGEAPDVVARQLRVGRAQVAHHVVDVLRAQRRAFSWVRLPN